MMRKCFLFVFPVLIALLYGCSQSTDSLIESIRSSSSRERMKAGIALMGRRGDPETTQKVIDVLNDEEEQVAFIAIQILGSLADTTAVAPLGKMLDHPNADFRASACYSLGSIGHESALDYLVRGIEDSVAAVRHSAVRSLGHLPHVYAPKYASHIYKMMRDEADSVRAAAVNSLYNYRNAENSDIFAEYLAVPLNDQSELVRYVAAQALGGGFKDTTVAGDLLIDALHDENKFVRLESIISLKKLRYKKAVPNLKEMFDTATVDEEFAITDAIKVIADETFPPL